MNRLPESSNGSIMPCLGLPFPEGFEGCWAGEFSAPDPPSSSSHLLRISRWQITVYEPGIQPLVRWRNWKRIGRGDKRRRADRNVAGGVHAEGNKLQINRG